VQLPYRVVLELGKTTGYSTNEVQELEMMMCKVDEVMGQEMREMVCKVYEVAEIMMPVVMRKMVCKVYGVAEMMVPVVMR